jgi:hypothetical protein
MRAAGWAEALVEAIESRKSTPFAWGSHDCCLFAADVALAITGVDYAHPVRGYSTREQAEEIIRGYSGMQAMVTALVGSGPVPVGLARRGDMVLAKFGASESVGILIGAQCAFAELRRGIAYHPMSVATCAWRIL